MKLDYNDDDIVDYVTQRLADLQPAIRQMYNDGEFEDNKFAYLMDPSYQKEAEINNEELESPSHANLTAEHMYEKSLEEAIEHEMMEQILSELNDMYPDQSLDLLDVRMAMGKHALKQQPSAMPSKLYHGLSERVRDISEIADPEVTGLAGSDAFHNDGEGGKYVFVSSEPSVAASYARYNRFGRSHADLNDQPTNYGDWVYEILTEGLNPEDFEKDTSGTPGEMMFGPQYRVKGPIKQEMVTITDQAGNTREVPRIQKVRYPSDEDIKTEAVPKWLQRGGLSLGDDGPTPYERKKRRQQQEKNQTSDERCKDVYIKPHLLEAVRPLYG